MSPTQRPATRYAQIIERVFFNHYAEGAAEVPFAREEFVRIAKELDIKLPKNLGDVIYAARYRTALPKSVVETARDGREWIIEGAGRGSYRFKLVGLANIEPTPDLVETKIPDATPGMIDMYALSDEQALLAKVRYNRLIDIFLGISCYSLQNHLRTTVPEMGQVETDEVYLGIDTRGAQYIIPVQAKGGSDKLSTVQIGQDFALCAHRFPELIALPVAAQFIGDNAIVLFAFELTNGHPAVSAEKYYRLVSKIEIEELRAYRARRIGN
jgi:hypothetical protein